MFKVNDDVVENDDVPNNEPVNPNVDVVDPVTTKLPVMIADPVYGNVGVLLPPGAQDADTANDALVANEADTA